jgi:mRNA interferase MazF
MRRGHTFSRRGGARPFSDLSASKLRLAIVLASAGRGDFILCQVTSNPYADPRAVELTDSDFTAGGLRRESYARPAKLFCGNRELIQKTVGSLSDGKLTGVIESVISILRPAT